MLVDTHVLLWLGRDDARLGRRARDLMASQHPVYYSSVSVLEIVIKSMQRKMSAPDDLCAHLDAEGLRQMPLTGEHAEALSSFPELVHHDPFDRSLVAQAWAERLTFLTADRRILALEKPWIVDAAN